MNLNNNGREQHKCLVALTWTQESGCLMTNKLSKCVQIARLYLEDDDAVNVEAFINKASFFVTNSNQEVLNLQYKVLLCENFRSKA
ncbi:COP9 signalosome complex subunit 4-like [Aegilops tauschii subsp. strangulata]|uniref:Uncharacterized protein n=1 Tax=Aegilops tauschii subsp. strangulata TaxID=200361 RepID=A0A453NDH3_AEGTS